jgi:hypothetical protein
MEGREERESRECKEKGKNKQTIKKTETNKQQQKTVPKK